MMSHNNPPSGQAPRVIVATRQQLFAEACQRLLEPEFEVIATLSDGSRLSESADILRPDVVVADSEMPRFKMLRHRRGPLAMPKLIILTDGFGEEAAIEELRCGASCVVSKHAGAFDLLTGIRATLKGGYYVSRVITCAPIQLLIAQSRQPQKRMKVTDRQRQVVRLLWRGMAIKEIAEYLGISKGTVCFHKYRAKAALDARSNADLFRYAILQEEMSCRRQKGGRLDQNTSSSVNEEDAA